jgi:(1->4)-alpha-D-glucan 1-alpha-D-glucosylmutase
MEYFAPFQRRVAWFGMLNSLSQTLLKLASPGVPDIYQGCERWNLSLVDPDNRRPVDHAANRESLRAMQSAVTDESEIAALVHDLLVHTYDGRIKQFVTWRALALRCEREALFRDGIYIPLAIAGTHADHLCAFARVLDDDCVIAIAPRLACTLTRGEPVLPIGADVWGDTRVALAKLPPQRSWREALTGVRLEWDDIGGATLAASAALNALPVALLAGAR